MDTLGSLIDKLCTVDLKMWNAQEGLYAVRHMTFEEFKEKYKGENLKELYDFFKKSTDLNYQRSQLIDEIDQIIVKMIEHAASGGCLDKFVQLKHKTY